MRTLLIRSATTATSVAGNLAMLMWSDGLQGTARRNAWIAMVEDSKRARDRAAVQASVVAASAAAPATAAEAADLVALAR